VSSPPSTRAVTQVVGTKGVNKARLLAHAGGPVARFLIRRRTLLGLLLPAVLVWFVRGDVRWFAGGMGLLALGQSLRVWAAGYVQKDEELTTGGPFAYCRHPLYLGSFVTCLGVGFMAGRWQAPLAVAAAFVLLYWPTVRAEERVLGEVFGADYQEYCSRVPRWLPRLRPAPNGTGSFCWRRVWENDEHRNLLGALLVALLMSVGAWR